ncbi:MAG: diaminopimelate epimerase [Alphaproteobacteria bacterium]
MSYTFTKMHGLGNDFVVLDAREQQINCTPPNIQRLSNRHEGIGCDQVLVIHPPMDDKANAYVAIYNADGQEAAACGNGMRCISWLLGDRTTAPIVNLETTSGLISAKVVDDHRITVSMGKAVVTPFTEDIGVKTQHPPLKVDVGNPHLVLFGDNIDLAKIGGELSEKYDTNVEAAVVVSPNTIRMRVWERGTGITRACGTGACAVAAASKYYGKTQQPCTIMMDGGPLVIDIADDNAITMTGDVAYVYSGQLGQDFFKG